MGFYKNIFFGVFYLRVTLFAGLIFGIIFQAINFKNDAAFIILLFLAILVPIIISVTLFKSKDAKAMTWAIIIGIFCFILGTIGFSSVVWEGIISKPPSVSGISVNEAPKHFDKRYFHFTDGRIISKYEGGSHYYRAARARSGSTTIDIGAAPLVTDSWAEENPINVWVAFERFTVDPQWNKNFRAGILIMRVADCKEDDLYLKAIKQAEKDFHIISDPKALIISWQQYPEEEVWDQFKIGLWILTGLIFLWLLAFLFSFFKKKKD